MRTLPELLNALGAESCSYAPRGGMGLECLAVRTESLFGLFADLLDEAEKDGSTPTVANALRGASMDTMGLNWIVYWRYEAPPKEGPE